MSNLSTEVGEFKGHKTFKIMNGEHHVISFGITKAKAILSVIKDIEKFVQENDSKQNQGFLSVDDLAKLTPEQLNMLSQFIKR